MSQLFLIASRPIRVENEWVFYIATLRGTEKKAFPTLEEAQVEFRAIETAMKLGAGQFSHVFRVIDLKGDPQELKSVLENELANSKRKVSIRKQLSDIFSAILRRK